MTYYREDPEHPQAPSGRLSVDPGDYFTAGLDLGVAEARADLAAAIDTAAVLKRTQRRCWDDLLAREFADGYGIAVDQITMFRALIMDPAPAPAPEQP